MDSPFYLIDPTKGREYEALIMKALLAAGAYLHTVPEVNFGELGGDIRPIVRELMDQAFQTSGEPRCGWFTAEGEIDSRHTGHFSAPMLEQLQPPTERRDLAMPGRAGAFFLPFPGPIGIPQSRPAAEIQGCSDREAVSEDENENEQLNRADGKHRAPLNSSPTRLTPAA